MICWPRLMTSQSRADALLAAWQLLRLQGVAPGLRLPVIDALCEIERSKCDVVSQFLDRNILDSHSAPC